MHQALSRKWRMRCHPTVPFHSQLQLPPPATLPFPPTRNAMPTEINRPNSSPKFPTSNWHCTRTHGRYGFPSDLKIPQCKIYASHHILARYPKLGERLFPEVKLFCQLYIKLIQPFNTPPMFSYLPHTYSVSNASCVRQNEQRKVHRIIRNWSALLFMHKVYMSVWFWHRHLDHIENLASPLLEFNTRPVWRL